MVTCGCVFFKIKLLTWICFGAVGLPSKKSRHGQRDISGIIRIAQRTPRGIVSGLENLGQVPWIAQLLPGIHIHQCGSGGTDERRMGGRRNLGNPVKDFNIRRTVVKIIITNETTIRLTAGGTVLFLVKLLEQRALVPSGAFVLLDRLCQIFLGEVKHANLECFVRFGIIDQMMQASPGTFKRLEILVMHNQVNLLRQLLINLSDNRFDGSDRIVGNEGSFGQGLFG